MSNYEILEKGKTYLINFNDCCVNGVFRGTFKAFAVEEPYEDGGHTTHFYEKLPEDVEYADIHFDTGYIGELWAGITFQEVPNEKLSS